MKFISTEGAPDIPLSILEAQESGRLVFFCGAGISSNVTRASDNTLKLPTFKELVDDVYNSHGWIKENYESDAIKSYQFDTALGLLESRIHNKDKTINLVRRAIIDNLRIDDNADLSSHDSLLSLSKTESGNYRIVTTNADHCFLNLDYITKNHIDTAPKLPVAKPHRWDSIVHLHGIIDDESDEEGRDLVFTSGDFGAAYLTEGWASKFVAELFRNFTVLFVGYSVNDPILKYITDTIAAENRIGYKGFIKPYILAKHESDNDLKYWLSRGIEPIFFYNNFDNLHNSLKGWSDYVRDGLNGKERIINDNARIIPSKPYELNDSITRVIHTLQEVNNTNEQNLNGYAAKLFSELLDPPAPIEWLPVLVEKGLLGIGETKELKSFGYGHKGDNLISPKVITRHLWNWLVNNHLENKGFIKWILDNGVFLHPEFKSTIRRKLAQTSKINSDYLLFWKIITSKDILFYNINTTGMYLIKDLEEKNIFSKKSLINLLTPKIKILSNNEIYFEPNQKNLFNSEVTISLRHHIYTDLKSTNDYPSHYIELLPQVSHLLYEALEYEEMFGRASKDHDLSYIKEEYSSNDGWIILVRICRDLWSEANIQNNVNSNVIIKFWKSYKYPVFRRLVLYSYTKEMSNQGEVINYLLEDEGIWLWSTCTKKEVFNLLKVYWPNLSETNEKKLLEAILIGPPDSFFQDISNIDENKELVDRTKFLILFTLNETEKKIPISTQQIFNELASNLPKWMTSPSDNEDEIDNKVDSVDQLYERSENEIVLLLGEDCQTSSQEMLDLFKTGFNDRSERIIEILEYLVINKVEADHIWSSVFYWFSNSEFKMPLWGIVSKLLIKDETDLFVNERTAISWWLKSATSKFKFNSEEEKLFWLICNRVLDSQKQEDEYQLNNVISSAINRPVGVLTNAVFNIFSFHNYKKGDIFKTEHLMFLDKITKDNNEFYTSGKIILASRLLYLYSVSPDWTKNNLLINFNKDKSKDANYLWQGYLWMIGINVDLALELKDLILSMPNEGYELDKYKKHYHELITIICLDYPAIFSDQEKRNLIHSIALEGLTHISELLSIRIFKDKVEQDQYWINRIKPFMDLVWLRDPAFQSEDVSLNLSLMSLSLSNTFEEAIGFLEPFLNPIIDPNTLHYHLRGSGLLNIYPMAVFKLLRLTFSNESEIYDGGLRDILNILITLKPEIESDPKYIEMDMFLKNKDL